MATNYANATYTEVIDLQTVADKTSIVGIHTPQGTSPYSRLKGFFTQFRKFRYNGIKSLIMVPAANLPVDPLGLTGVVGTTDLMDPRDSLNPILFHGCHGEYLTSILNEIYTNGIVNSRTSADYVQSVSGADLAETSPTADEFFVSNTQDVSQYYDKLTDSTWKKFGIQSGVKLRGLRPLVHQVVQNMPTLPYVKPVSTGGSVGVNAGVFDGMSVSSNAVINNGFSTLDSNANGMSAPTLEMQGVLGYDLDGDVFTTNTYKQQFTNRMTTLSWLPTATVPLDTTTGQAAVTLLPKLFMGILVLPPAYNVEQFFRLICVHSFSFKDFTSSLSLMDRSTDTDLTDGYTNVPYTNWIDYGDTLDTIGGKSHTISDGVA